MSSFKLEIITPNREFLETQAEALTFSSTDGEVTVLK
jgi:F0F1-type ATP synthase epsilon subunit